MCCRNIVVLGDGFTRWWGGVDFLRYCTNSLSLVCDDNTKIFILLPHSDQFTLNAKIKSKLSTLKRIFTRIVNCQRPFFSISKSFSAKEIANEFSNIGEKVEIIFYRQGIKIEELIKDINADVLIPCLSSLGKKFPIPWVGYIYDFQHKYFPEFFASTEIKMRNTNFDNMISDSSSLIVNSKSVKKDINKFYPNAQCKVFELPFSAAPLESWFEPSSEDLIKKYKLPTEYFVICNQFWIHKDHTTAFKALKIYNCLKVKKKVHLVCTGNNDDIRHPEYFESLMSTVAQLGLLSRVHFLGHIPKKDQLDIMCGSIAVLQPSLFEGGPGGGAIYDAVAMGVPAIVSDIPINKELYGQERLFFFKTADPVDLAKKMKEVQSLAFAKQDKQSLLFAGRRRLIEFGLRLLEAIEYAINSNKRPTD